MDRATAYFAKHYQMSLRLMFSDTPLGWHYGMLAYRYGVYLRTGQIISLFES